MRGTPYVHHCFDVARRVAEAGIVEEFALVAAVLHDVVEDTDVTLERVREQFGPNVATIVGQLTLPLDCRKDYPKKLAFQMAAMKEMDVYGRAIKIADKTSNVSDLLIDPPKWSPENVRNYAADAKRVVDVVRTENLSPELEVSLIREFDKSYNAVMWRHR